MNDIDEYPESPSYQDTVSDIERIENLERLVIELAGHIDKQNKELKRMKKWQDQAKKTLEHHSEKLTFILLENI